MKKILLILIAFTFYNTNAQDSLKVKDKDRMRLEVGAGIGFGAGSMSYKDTRYESSSETSSSSELGIASDILNEYKLFTELHLNSWFGIGAEFGRQTFFRVGDSGSDGNFGTIQVDEFISGIYVAPYLNFSSFKVGMTYMSPTPSTWFTRANENIASDVNYEDLSPGGQKAFDTLVEDYLNVFIAYQGNVTKQYGIPISYYVKFAYDLSNPIDYSKVPGFEYKHYYRGVLTLGMSAQLDVLN
jgi:hypothetical protein